MPTLNILQTKRRLRSVPEWSKRGRAIRRRFEFRGFLEGIDFVNRVARRAEKADHHPDIDVRWNKVTLTLSTHSEGGLTGKDFSMARQCDLIFSRFLGA
jgi:4a-hydroxytetrahydrobiopterin dehydratase